MMKLTLTDDKVILYINRMYIESLDLKDKEETEKYIEKSLQKFRNKYDIKINGYYIVNLYVDMSYGLIIEMRKEELEYLDYFSNQIEMNTRVIHGSFLYEISDIDMDSFKYFYVYKLNGRLFLRVKKDLSDIEMGKLIEMSKIIYGKEAEQIIKMAEIVR